MAGSMGRRALEQWAAVPAAPAGSQRHHAARQRRRCRCTLELNELRFLCVISFSLAPLPHRCEPPQH